MQTTHPRLPLACGNRVLWERDLLSGELSPEERQLAIREPFELLGYLAYPRSKNLIALAFLGIFIMAIAAIPGALIAAAFPKLPTYPGVMATFIFVVVFGGMFSPLVWSDWRERKKQSTKIQLMAARSLRPVRPSRDELAEVHEWASAMNLPVARFIRPERLLGLISASPDRSLTNCDEVKLIDRAFAMQREQEAEHPVESESPESAEDAEDD